MNHALSDITIVDFSTPLPGPYATQMLADLGATVISINSPEKGNPLTEVGAPLPGTNVSARHAWLYRNKKMMALNLKTDEGLEIAKKLIQKADVMIEEFRPGIMTRFGLDYASVKKWHPEIIYCSITGYGQSGPDATRAGHDINFFARSGFMAHDPHLFHTQIADIAGGALHAVIGILTALHHRSKTGQGQYIDVSMLNSLLAFNTIDGADFLAYNKKPEAKTLFTGGSLYDFFETADGQWLAVGALEPKFWRAFCQIIDQPDWIQTPMKDLDDPRKERLIARLKEKTKEEWIRLFQAEDCCVDPVNTLAEALEEDLQIQSQNMVKTIAIDSDTSVRQIGCPIVFSETPAAYRHIGRPWDADNASILFSLGYDKNEIEAMANKGAFS